jgi:hypothetical protein
MDNQEETLGGGIGILRVVKPHDTYDVVDEIME